jgi:hypothetical protein
MILIFISIMKAPSNVTSVGKISTMELICVIVSGLLAVVQPLVYAQNKNVKIDTMATIDVLAVYLLGVYSICYLAVTINKLINRNSAHVSEDKIFFFASAGVFGLIGIPVLIFNLIELFTHPDMFHLHVDFITAIILAIDVVLGLASSILLGFFYTLDGEEAQVIYQMIPLKTEVKPVVEDKKN